MSPELIAHLSKILRYKTFSKGDIILNRGRVCSHIYFLETGLIRIYHWKNDKEVTTWFLKEGDLFISVHSFFQQRPSAEFIVAMEDCACWGITFEELEETCKLFPEFNWHEKMIFRTYYSRKEIWDYEMPEKPQERYDLLMRVAPELVQRVPAKILATYLDMSERAFTRARNNEYHLKKKKK